MTRAVKWRGAVASGCVVVAAFLLSLLVLAPATLFDAGLQRATAGRLRLAQATGSLWTGGGVLEIRAATGAGGVGKDLSWALQPRALLRGRLDYSVNFDHAARPFPVRISMHGIELSNVDFSLPASAMAIAVPRLALVEPRGDLDFHIAHFSSVDGIVATHVVMTWKNASSALTAVAPLGTYQLRLDGAAGFLNATLHTRSGPLRLDGAGSWRGGGRQTLSVNACVDAEHRTQLMPLLHLIAVQRGGDCFDLQFAPPLSGVSTTPHPKNS